MATVPSPWDDEFFQETDKEEYDAFFSADGAPRQNGQRSQRSCAPEAISAAAASSSIGAGAAGGDIESEYDALSPRRLAELLAANRNDGDAPSPPGPAGQQPPLNGEGGEGGGGGVASNSATSPRPSSAGAVTFALDDDDDEVGVDTVQGDYDVKDCRPPELPEPPSDFTAEDLRLREVLADFYFRHRAENLANINLITKRYRGRAVSHLWAQLALKYRVEAHNVVELLARTLYESAPFEYGEEHQAESLEARLAELQSAMLGSMQVPEDRAELLRRCLETKEVSRSDNASGDGQGSDGVLRMLCFRGLHQGSNELRPQVWKLLLGCLPVARPSEWNVLQGEMRSLYAKYKSEVLVVSNELKFEVKVEGSRLMEAMHLLQQIQKDVDRTRQDVDHFRRPSTRVALISLLFVYAHVNPDVQYVQGMNEVAAVALHVMSVDPEYEEADAFWCFTFLMREIKVGFTQALERAADCPPDGVAALDRLLRTYDPELAKHLNKVGCPIAVFTFRWCTLLFAQDVSLEHAVRLWDGFIADPKRFDFVSHACLAALLSRREELLAVEEQGALVELLRRIPRQPDFDAWLRRAWAVCSLERRAQTPAFPARSAALALRELSGWAQQLSAGVARNVAPAVKEKVGQASGTAAEAAKGSVSAVKAWLEQDVPIQPETAAKAQVKVSSWWQAVRTSGAAAVSQTQRLAAEYGQTGKVEQTAAALSGAVDAAASTSAAVFSTLTSALAKKPPEEQ